MVAVLLGASASRAQPQSPAQPMVTLTQLTSPLPSPLVSKVELQLPKGMSRADLDVLVDVRTGQPLSRRAVQLSVERLFSTGRFADVVVRSLPLPDGTVSIVFELSVPQRIHAVHLTGEVKLGEDVLQRALHLNPGDAYSRERLDEGEEVLAHLYGEKGYEHARVKSEAVTGSDGLDVEFHVSEGEATRLVGVTLAGSPGMPLTRVLTALGLHPGDVLDRSGLSEGLERVKALYRSERFYQMRLGEPVFDATPDGAWLSLPVSSGPRFALHFVGQRSFSEGLLIDVLGYDGAETLDRGLLASLAQKVETFYRYRGFLDVHVRPRERLARNGENAALIFDVEEGRQLDLKQIVFEGNTAHQSAELVDLVQQRVSADRPPIPGVARILKDPTDDTPGNADIPDGPVDPRYVFVEEAYRQAAETLTERFHEEGYLQGSVKLDSLDVDLDPNVAVVRFHVDEGPFTRVRSVRVEGTPRGYTVPSLGDLKQGRPLRASASEAARLELVRTLGRAGWLFSQVKVETTYSQGNTLADLTYRVEPGPRVRVGQVIIRGLELTREPLVRANVLLKSGAVLDPELLFETQRRLTSLGLFKQVLVRFLAPDTVENTKDVVVEVRERPRLSGDVSGGYSLADGPRVTVDAVYPNLFGEGLTLSGRGQINYVGASTQILTRFFDPSQLQGLQGLAGRANLSLQQQRFYQLLPAQVSARLDLIAERVLRPSYRFNRYAAVAGVTWVVARWLTIGLNYELEQDSVQAAEGLVQLLPTLLRGDEQRLLFPVGVFNLQTLAPTFALDFRDNPTNPTRGLFISVGGEITKDLGATLTDAQGNPTGAKPEIFTFKGSANISGYIPFGNNIVLALSARGGRIVRLDPNSITIAPKRFFLGGATTLRGFYQDGLLPEDQRILLHQQVGSCRGLANPGGCTSSAAALLAGQQLPSEGGELYELAKAELRIPIYGSFALGIFGEAGNLWLDVHQYRPFELRYVAGFGVRYLTPVGPLALDLAFNLIPDSIINETIPNVQFSVGLF